MATMTTTNAVFLPPVPPKPVRENDGQHHLNGKWVLWSHFSHDSDWSLKSYTKIKTICTVEEAVAVISSLPPEMVKKCMLFLMRDGITPRYEDTQNASGGYFSYKVSDAIVIESWMQACFATMGETLSESDDFLRAITGINISPKKGASIIKLWMRNRNFRNPKLVTEKVRGITAQGCLFSTFSEKC